MILGSFGYLHAPWRRSTKLFTKRLRHCEGKSTCISCLFAWCSPSAQSLNMVCFPWSWACLDTFMLHEDTPQNCSRNSYAIVKVSPLVFRVFFCLMLTICSVTLFCLMLGSVGYLHTPWRHSTKLFAKRLSCCGGKSTCILWFSPYTIC